MFPCHLFLPWKTLAENCNSYLPVVAAGVLLSVFPRCNNKTTRRPVQLMQLACRVWSLGAGANHGKIDKIDNEGRPKHGHDEEKSIPALPLLHTYIGCGNPAHAGRVRRSLHVGRTLQPRTPYSALFLNIHNSLDVAPLSRRQTHCRHEQSPGSAAGSTRRGTPA